MGKRIENISLKSFRGATCAVNIRFDKHRPVVMLFGENGTGKSTIVDALDCICNSEIGSLTHRKLGGGVKAPYLASIGCTGKDICAALEYGGEKWTASLKGASLHIDDKPGRPIAKILRRAELMEFAEADPAKRYKTIAEFISIPHITAAETNLRTAARNAQRDLEAAVNARIQAEEELEKYWQAEGKPDGTAEKWAKNEVAKDCTAITAETAKRGELLAVLGDLDGTVSSIARAREQLNRAIQTAESAQKKVDEEAAKAVADGSGTSLLNLLQDAKKYFEELPAEETCPVCERGGLNPTDLLKRLQKRIGSFGKLETVQKALDTAKKAVETKKDLLVTAGKTAGQKAQSCLQALEKSALPEVVETKISSAVFPLIQSEKHDLADSAFEDELKTLVDAVQPIIAIIQARQEADQKVLLQQKRIQQDLDTIAEKSAVLKELDTLSKRLTKALKIVEDKRKAFVDGVLDSISGDVDSLYQMIHPKEHIGNLRLFLDPNKQGSIKFEGSFAGQDNVIPQAYYSESHLDTLGVCVFLALIRHYADDDTIIALDDVFTSVDQSHLERIIKMLHNATEKFSHVILTTHYRPWRDRYKNLRGPISNVQLIELGPWNPTTGITHSATKFSVGELEDALSQTPVDRQTVASKAGILLENMLDILALKYSCKVPRQPEPKYTLAPLMQSLNKKLKKALRIELIDSKGDVTKSYELQEHLDNLFSLTPIRNEAGCHYNESGGELSDSDITSFGQQTMELYQLMTCNSCEEIPKNKKSGSYWECRCKSKRLHPLHQPG